MNIGPMEIAIVLILALLVFGPKRLPQAGRSLGQAVRELRKATQAARSDLGLDRVAADVKDLKSSLGVDEAAAGVNDLKSSLTIDLKESNTASTSGLAVSAGAAAASAPQPARETGHETQTEPATGAPAPGDVATPKADGTHEPAGSPTAPRRRFGRAPGAAGHSSGEGTEPTGPPAADQATPPRRRFRRSVPASGNGDSQTADASASAAAPAAPRRRFGKGTSDALERTGETLL